MAQQTSRARFNKLTAEALQAPFSGWDFSFLRDRWSEIELPWDYKQRVLELMQNASTMLDMGTGPLICCPATFAKPT